MPIDLNETSPPQRCPYCHDLLEVSATYTCPDCATPYHSECVAELGRCGTAGCKSGWTGLPTHLGKRCRICGEPLWNPFGLAHLFPCEPYFPHAVAFAAALVLTVVLTLGMDDRRHDELLGFVRMAMFGLIWAASYGLGRALQNSVQRRREEAPQRELAPQPHAPESSARDPAKSKDAARQED